MKMRCKLAGMLAALAALTAQAQTNFWWTNNTSGVWSGGNWTNEGPTLIPVNGGSSDYGIIFQNTSAVLTTNDAGTPDFALNRLQFSGANTVTIFGGTGTNLVFTDSSGGVLPQIVQNTASSVTLNIGLNLATNTTFTGSGAGLVTVNSNVTGVGGLIMSGTNYTLLLSGSNTYTGGNIINAGVLKISTNLSIAGNITINSGGTFELNGQDIRTTVSQVSIGGTGAVGQASALVNSSLTGTAVLSNLTLATDATIGGAGRIDIRDLVNGNGNTLTATGSNVNDIRTDNALTNLAGINVVGGIFRLESSQSWTGLINVASGATLESWGLRTQAVAVALNNGTLSGNNNTSTWNGAISLTNTGTFSATANMVVNGNVSGSGSLAKTGGSSLTLAGSNSYSGLTTITTGTVVVANNNALGLTTSGTIVTNAATLQLANGVTVTGESLTFTTTNGNSTLGVVSGAATWAGSITNAGTAAVILNNGGGQLTLSSNIASTAADFWLWGNGTGTLSGAINLGSGSLTIDTLGAWNLNSAGNTWNATILKNTRNFIMGATNALPATTVVSFNGGNADGKLTLNGFNQTIGGLSSGIATGNVVNASATASILTISNSSSSSFGGTLGGTNANDNNFALIKLGTGTQILSGTNTYSGGTTISNGVLGVGSIYALGSGLVTWVAPVASVFSNTAVLTAGTGVTNAFNLVSNITFNTTSGNLLLSGAITNTGMVTKQGLNTLLLAGANSYSGGTIINAGNVQFNTLAAIPANGLITINSGGALNATGAYATVQDWFTSGRIVTNSAGAIALTTYNNTAMDFSTYTGLYLGAVGTVTNDGAITPANNTYRLGGGGGTLVLTNVNALTDDVSARSLAIGGGSGTVLLTASNSYSGATAISNVVLLLQNNHALGSTNAGTTIYGANGTIGSQLQLTNNITVAEPLTVVATAAGRSRIYNMGGNNTLSGSININSLANGVSFDSSVGFLTISGSITGGAFSIRGNANGAIVGSIAINGDIQKTDGGTWTIGAAGQTYSWNNTALNVGTLQMGAANVLPATTILTLGQGATENAILDLNGYNQTVAGLVLSSTGGTKMITNTAALATFTVSNNAAVTFGGIIAGPLALNKSGLATLTLTGTNTLTGATTINGGTLTIVPAYGLTNSEIAVTNGTLLLGSTNAIGAKKPALGPGAAIGASYALDTNFVNWATNRLGGVPEVFALGVNSSSNLDFSGALTNTFLGAAGPTNVIYSGAMNWGSTTLRLGGGAGTLHYTNAIGAGSNLVIGPVDGNWASVVLLTNSSAAFNGTTVIQSGSLHAQKADALGNATGAGITVSNGAALQLQGSFTLAANAITLNGTGVTNAGALRFISGAITNAGAITIASASRINADAGAHVLNGNITNNATQLYFGGVGTQTVNGFILGAGGLTKDGAGVVALTNLNTYGGVTIISNGTLRVNHLGSGVVTLGTNNLTIVNGVLELNNLPNTSPSFIRALGTGTNQVQITGGVSGFSAVGNNAIVRLNNSTSYIAKWGTSPFNPSIFVLNAATGGKQLTFDNILDLNGTNREIDVYNSQNANNQFSILAQAVTNSAGTTAGLIKGGPGVLQLSSTANSYNGPTIVIGGVLHLNASGVLPSTSNLILSNGVLQQAYGNFTYTLGTGAGQLQLLPGFSGFSAYNGTRTVMLNNSTNTLTWGVDINPTALVLNEFSAANGNLIFANGLDLNGADRIIAAGSANSFITGPVTNSTGTAGLMLMRTAIGAGTLVVLANNFMYNGATIVSNGATLQLGDFWTANPNLPGINGNAGNIANTGTIVFANAGDVTLTGSILGGAGAVTKNSRGTLTMTGTNTYTGITRINQGTLTLDFSSSSAASNIISSSSTLYLGGLGLGGGVVAINGKAGVTNNQTFNGLNALNAGASAITVTSGAGGAANLALGAITRTALGGGTLDFSLPSSGQITTTTTNIFGILGGYATVGGADWATVTGGSSPYVITNYTGYTVVAGGGNIADGSNTNVRITGNVGLAAATTAINTLAVTNDGGAYTVTLAGKTLRLGTTGGILVPSGSGGLTIGSTANEGFLIAGPTNNVASELVFINNSASPITVNSSIISNGTAAVTLTKAGSGAITFNGTNFYGGQTFLNGGTATFTSTNTFIGNVTIAGGASMVLGSASSNTFLAGQVNVNNGTLTINSPTTMTNILIGANVAGGRAVINIGNNLNAGRIQLGPTDNNRSASAVFQTNGTVSAFAGLSFTIADGINNYGYYGISGGVATGNEFVVSYRGVGILDVSGTGVVAPTNVLRIVGQYGGIGQINVYPGGIVNTPAGSTTAGLQMNNQANSLSTAYLNLLGGTVNASVGGPTKPVDLMVQAGNTGIVNLNSGNLIADQVKASAAGTSIFNFNGGTLTVADGTTLGGTFMTGLAAAYVYTNGAIINTGTNSTTIGQSLLAPSGYGVASIGTNASCGGQYIAQPFVMIGGGSGTGAVAIAQLNYTTGTITNFLVVNPGSGYASDDVLTVTLLGGGPLTAPANFTISEAALAANNTSGGLIKLGTGTLALNGTNTFVGNLTVSNGTLRLGRNDTYTLPNLVTGAGSLIQAGGGTLILTNSNNYGGNTYVLGGALRGEWGVGIPTSGNLVLTGGVWETSSGSIGSSWGTSPGQFQLPGSTGGFSAVESPLIVNLGGDSRMLVWGGTNIFSPSVLVLQAASANTNLTFQNGLDLNNASRTILVNAAIATITGNITNSGTASSTLTKGGVGTLVLQGNNRINSNLTVSAGTLVFDSGVTTGLSNLWVGTVAGSPAQMIISNGAQVLVNNNNTGATGDTIGNAAGANSNSVIVAGPNSMWNLGNTRLIIGNAASTGNWMRVDQGGIVTNGQLFMYGIGGALIITNGGQFYSLADPNIGRQGSSNSVIVAGTDGAGNQAKFSAPASSLRLGTNPTLGGGNMGNSVWVGQGGLLNAVGYLVGNDTNASGNSVTITNGGQAVSSGAIYIGNSVGANSNWVTVAGGGAKLDLVAGNTLSIGAVATATGNVLNVLSGGILTNVSTIFLTNGVGSVFNLTGEAYVSSVNLGVASAQMNFDGGVLYARANGNLLSGLGTNYFLAGGGTIDTVGFTVTNSVVNTGNGGLIKLGSGALTLTGANTYGGATVVSNGTLKLAAGGSLNVSTAVYVDSMGIMDFDSNSQIIAGLTGGGLVTNGGGQLTLNLVNATNTFGGLLKGASAFQLTGGGTLIMTGTNSFGGGTLVSNATLAVNGLHNGGVITVISNGFVGGSGPISTLYVDNGGTYAPGNSIATQYVASLTLTNAGVLEMELGASAQVNDRSIVTNSLTISGGVLKLNLAAYTFVAGASYTIVDWNGASGFTPTDSAQWLTLSDVGSASNGLLWAQGATLPVVGGTSSTNLFTINYGDELANGHAITLTAVPEPGTASLLGLIGVAWLVRRLRRRRAQS